MSITALLDLSTDVVDFTIEDNGSGSGSSVPLSRILSTSAPLTIDGGSSADLSADRLLGISLSPVGTVAVSTLRTLQGTAPIRVAGDNAAHDLSADRVISSVPFTGSVDGHVTHNASGVQGKYLKDDNTWGTSTAAGVTSLLAGSGISVSPASGLGDVTVGGVLASIGAYGIVPATGGTFPTKFLAATSPISWQIPGSGSFLTLQGYPGVGDAGSGRVTGNFTAEGKLIAAGDVANINFGDLPSGFLVVGGGAGMTRSAADTFCAPLLLRKSRGNAAAPTAVSSSDQLGGVFFQGRPNGSVWSTTQAAIVAYADGSAVGNSQPQFLDIGVSGQSQNTLVRIDGTGLSVSHPAISPAIGASAPSTPSVRAIHSFDIAGSFGLNIVNKTANFTMSDTDCMFAIDASGVAPTYLAATMLTAVGRAGRVVGFIKIDTSVKEVAFIIPCNLDGQTPVLTLKSQGECVVMVSDGVGWWITSDNRRPSSSASAASAVLSNSVVETNLFTGSWMPQALGITGGTYHARVYGIYSTTGTPTLRFRFRDIGSNLISDSGAVTCPNNVTDAPFQCQLSFYHTTGAGPAASITTAMLWLGQAAGAGAAMLAYNMGIIAGVAVTGGIRPYFFSAQWGTASASNGVQGLCLSYERSYGLVF